jgi:hypothetical protein
MPTVGWILENAIERYWEGQPTPRDAVPAPPPVFICKRCGKKLSSPEELRNHFSLEHPLELPVLYVRREPLLRESVLRSAIGEDDVELVQCTRCDVQMDGDAWRPMELSKFRSQFAQTSNSTWNVRLVHKRALDNSRTEEKYHIRFRIPAVRALNAVDSHFVSMLVRNELRHPDLERFEASLPDEAPAREYGGALGDYALGIILKERRNPPHAPIGFSEFSVKMRSALEVLRLFSRPVALAVCSSIRFNLNDFCGRGAVNVTDLEIGLRFFRSLANEGAENGLPLEIPKGGVERPICPVDHITNHLLSACRVLSTSGKISLAELEVLRQFTRGMVPVSEQDLVKIHVICAEGYLRQGRWADALPHLRAIQFDPVLHRWAQHQLGSVSKHGS